MSSSNVGNVGQQASKPVSSISTAGYLMPPTASMIDSTLSPPEMIERVFRITEAYLFHCVLRTFPSPKFQLPTVYEDLLKGLPEASVEHVVILQKSLHSLLHSEAYMWKNKTNPFAQFTFLEEKTSMALRAVIHHFFNSTVMTRLFKGIHDKLLTENIDIDPNPPVQNELTEHEGFALQRTSSIGPPGTDLYFYQGSYGLYAEKIFGYVHGTEYDEESNTYLGGSPGFFREVGQTLITPALSPFIDHLVARYRAYPLEQFSWIFQHLGAPRYGYVFSPSPVVGEPTAEDNKLLTMWENCHNASAVEMRTRYFNLFQNYKASVATLKSDIEASLALLSLSTLKFSSNESFAPDVIEHIAGFIGRRLVDSAPELGFRRRCPVLTDRYLNNRGALLRYFPDEPKYESFSSSGSSSNAA